MTADLREYAEANRMSGQRTSGWKEMMTVGTIERKHGGLGGKEYNPAHEATARFNWLWRRSGSRHDIRKQKSRTFPVREHVGSAKNLLTERQRNAQQTRRHNASCAGISICEQKEY